VTYTDTGLTTDQTYVYRVKVRSFAGSSGYSNTQTVTPTLGNISIPASALRLWLRADTGVASDSNGKVSTWSDQSGNSADATQSSSSIQPLLVASAANGQSAVRFDGAGSVLNLPNFMSGASAGELFVIVKTAELRFAAGMEWWSLGRRGWHSVHNAGHRRSAGR